MGVDDLFNCHKIGIKFFFLLLIRLNFKITAFIHNLLNHFEIVFGLIFENNKYMMKQRNQIFKHYIVIIILVIIGFYEKGECQKSIDLSSTQPITIPDFYYSQVNQISSKDVEEIIPMDMEPTSNSSEVATRIADRSLQVWARTVGKDVSLVKVAKNVERQLKADVDLSSGSQPDDLHHRVKLNVKAFQTLAEIEYSGWTTALINYNFSRQKSLVKLSEKILSNKDLFVMGESDQVQTVSSVGLSWKW